MPEVYDLAIIGSGPAGLFCALKLVKNGYKNIIIIDKGQLRTGGDDDSLTEGFAGAGAHSDGKVNMTHKVGGTIYEITGLKKYQELLEEQDQMWLDYSPTEEQRKIRLAKNPRADIESRMFVPGDEALSMRAKALANHMELETYDIRHLGTDNMLDSTNIMYKYLIDNGVTIKLNREVTHVDKEGEDETLFQITTIHPGRPEAQGHYDWFNAKNVLVSIGRSGGHFFRSVMNSFDIPLKNNGVDIGVRVEVPNVITNKLLKNGIYEPKMLYRSPKFDDRVRTFCWCDSGFVAVEEYRDTKIKLVNGHSYADKKSENTNFALLVTKTFSEPFNDPHGYAEGFAKMANMLSGGNVLVQRYGDFKAGRRSTDKRITEGALIPSLSTAVAGDIALALPYRQMYAIDEMLQAMDNVLPGIASDYTLMYALEAKFFSNKVDIDSDSMTIVNGLYVAGDGSGWTRGLNQAAIQGILVANGLLGNENVKSIV
jgi:uncharacterized FAD-dependent dehydrogenase